MTKKFFGDTRGKDYNEKDILKKKPKNNVGKLKEAPKKNLGMVKKMPISEQRRPVNQNKSEKTF